MLLLPVVLVFPALAYVFSATSQPNYEARSTVYVSLPFGTSAGELSQGALFTQAQMQSYAQLATKPIVLEPVIEELGLETTPKELARSVSAKVVDETAILEVAGTGASAQAAADLTNAVTASLITEAASLSPTDARGKPSVSMRVLGAAEPPEFPSSPNTRRNVVLGLLAGLALAAGLAYLLDSFDSKMRDPAEFGELTDVPVLAEIPESTGIASGIVVVQDPLGPDAEAFRRLRANLQFLNVDSRALSLVVTSSVPGEGKSTVAVNLAFASALAGDRVLLVDGDLRKPTVAARLSLEGSVGLTTVLTARLPLNDALQSLRVAPPGQLDVLTAGEIPPNPAELLGSEAMTALWAQMESSYETIIVDSPPILSAVDATIVARLAANTLVVARLDLVRRDDLRHALEELRRGAGASSGLVINGVGVDSDRPYVRYQYGA